MKQETMEVTIQTEYIKLDSLLKFAGLCDTVDSPRNWCSRALFG